jgi:preprotein translocase subunit SecG
MGALFVIVLSLLAIFLILLILVQRGRGGGLAGALGGMGGSSAFGAKAGDVFTRITIYAATFWIAICLIATFWAKHGGDALTRGMPSSSSSSPLGEPAGRPTQESPGQGNSTVPPAGQNQPQATQSQPEGGQNQPQAEAPPAATGATGNAESPSGAPASDSGSVPPANNP